MTDIEKLFYHDLHCNANRLEPMGNEGCSCYMFQRVRKLESQLTASRKEAAEYREALQKIKNARPWYKHYSEFNYATNGYIDLCGTARDILAKYPSPQTDKP